MLKMRLPYNLQFFAEPNDDNNDDVNNPGDGNSDNGKNGEDDHKGGNEKTFTQDEVNRMMAREKREGKTSMLKSLGFNNEEDAKNALNLLKALTDSQKTAEQKANEKKDNAINDKAAAEKRADLAEAKLTCFMNGVDKDSIDDVLSIALKKVSDDKSLDDVISDMKSEKRYSYFFGTSDDSKKDEGKKDNDNGTGRTPGHNKTGDDEKPGDYGKRLAQSNMSSSAKKSSFF